MERTRWVGALLVPVSAIALCVAQVALHTVPARAAAAPVEPGAAAAGANLLGVSPGVSGLTLTTTFGESTAALEHAESQAKSASVDLGSLGLVLATSTFCGVSDLPKKNQPQPLVADSDTGPRAASHDTAGQGRESVMARRNPESAAATTTSVSEALPGIFEVTGHSTAAVRFDASTGQTANSSVTEDVTMLGGVVKLRGLNWQARRRAGATTTRSTHFSFGQVTIGGVPLAPSTSPAAELKAINTALAPFGFSFLRPTTSFNHRTGAVSIGPLVLRFRGSSIEKTLVSPGVNAVISLENLLAKQSKPGANCAEFSQLLYNIGTNIETLLNVGLSISEGAGVLDIDFGGATASAQKAASYDNPFGPGGSPTTPPGAGSTGGPAPPASGSSSSTAPAGSGVGAGSGQASKGGAVTSNQGAALTASRVVCRSTSTAGSQRCWRGLATIGSGAALATGVGLLAADLYFTRRRRPLLRRRYRRV